jgi:NAD+ synthase (glutamine-hydrolysing)
VTLRLALAQINPRLGDLEGNAALIRGYARHAKEAGADLVAFPEMALTGYPIEDLALRPSFIQASKQTLVALAAALVEDGCGDLAVVVGFLDGDARPQQGIRPLGRNALAILHGGRVIATYAKHHLPNYGVFDEQRYFQPGNTSLVARIAGVDIAFAICEDIWQEGGPVAEVRARGAALLLVINGSPYEREKDDRRIALCRTRAVAAGSALAYVNLVGGQDELVFDGDSMVVDASGQLLVRAPQFTDGLMCVDLDLPVGSSSPDVLVSDVGVVERVALDTGVAPRLDEHAEIWQALVVGLRDYVEKNNFRSVVLGLSGGIDSAVVAALAVDAIGAERVYAISMPSSYSSSHSRDDALDLAARTKLQYQVIEIEPLVRPFIDRLSLSGLAEENIQARVRGMTLMALSNQQGHLVLATGNKSELAVGYSTIYGDAVGGFAPIKDVSKTMVWELARWRNGYAKATGGVPPIPERSISKEPSAELRPGQRDSDSLPDYLLLDQILEAYVEGNRGVNELAQLGFDPETIERVLQMVDRAEYKRRQYPPGTKISLRAFGRDRRLPITNGWKEQ